VAPLAVILAWGSAGPRPAVAGDAAPSAYAESQAMPAFLLETTWLGHLHPQAMILGPSRLGAMASSAFEGTGGMQAVLRGRDGALFVLSQSNVDLSSVTLSGDMLQAGAAWRLGGARLGAVVRGTLTRDDQSSVDQSGSSSNTRAEELRADRIETAVGLGWGEGRVYFDLTFEAFRERFETFTRQITSRDEFEIDIDGTPVTRYGGAAHLGLPGPWSTRLGFAGSFADHTARVSVDYVLPDSIVGTSRRDEYGHRWRSGLTVERDLNTGTLRFFALYENLDGPAEYSRLFSSYREYHTVRDTDTVQFGASLRRPFWRESLLLIGLQNLFHLEKRRTFRQLDDGSLDYDTETTERITRTFGWGLQRTFDNLDLTGSMRTDLALEGLFASLDAIYRF
jgi:hypothetical protein